MNRSLPTNDFSLCRGVAFARPAPALLRRHDLCGIDMHVHTRHSDGSIRVKDALRIARKKGFGLSITDHNEISGVLEAEREADGVPVIPGIEISTRDGPHILAYFYSTAELVEFHAQVIAPNRRESPYLATKLTAGEVALALEDYTCITSAAHPCGYLLFCRGIQKAVDTGMIEHRILHSFDAFEVICGTMTRTQNIRATESAEKHMLGITGGTDSHLLTDIGKVLTCCHEHDRDGFLDAVAGRRSRVIGTEKTLAGKAVMGACVLPHYIPHLVPSLQIHYEQNANRLFRALRGHTRCF